jgi:hypothetical protein
VKSRFAPAGAVRLLRPAFFLIPSCILLLLAGCARSSDAAEPGFLEGRLKITSLQQVEPSDANPAKGGLGNGPNYAAYPLIVLSKDGKKEIRQVTADKDGNYRVSLPPGDYVLDAKGRAPKRIRAKPRKFTVVSNKTVRVDFELDTGIR